MYVNVSVHVQRHLCAGLGCEGVYVRACVRACVYVNVCDQQWLAGLQQGPGASAVPRGCQAGPQKADGLTPQLRGRLALALLLSDSVSPLCSRICEMGLTAQRLSS